MDLLTIDLFKGFNESSLKDITQYFKSVSYSKKDSIFLEGDPSNFLYIVKKGKIKITKNSQDGKEIILEIISAGDFFGAVAVLKGIPYPANAIAKESAELLIVSRKDFNGIMEKYPSLERQMLLELSNRIKDSHETIKDIAYERVENRIISLLKKLADKIGKPTDSGILIDMKLTNQDIADMVGTTLESTIRVTSKLKKSNKISVVNGMMLIRDKKALI